MYLFAKADHGLRSSKEEVGKAAVREEKPGEEDPHSDASVREGQEGSGTVILLLLTGIKMAN